MGKLPNGLTYYIRKNAKPEKKVELRLVANAGSILEDVTTSKASLTLLSTWRSMARRTLKRTTSFHFLQSIGVEFGADLNAVHKLRRNDLHSAYPDRQKGEYRESVFRYWKTGPAQ